MAGHYIVDGRRIGADEIKDSDLLTARQVEINGVDTLTTLPELPAATLVWFVNLPLVTALPELPVATDVWFENLPLVKSKD